MIIFWYALTTFVGAALLFIVEPLLGRQLLPLLGGAPAVWIACVLFFQTALLAGYAYAHLLVSWVPRRVQPFVHVAGLAAAWWFLPLQAPVVAPNAADEFPILWVFAHLARTIGVPFVITSATAPLVQAWFGRSRHAHAADPYFLYAASNAGSLAALLAYPTIVEPNLALGAQARFWSWGFGLLSALMLVCAAMLVLGRSPSSPAQSPPPASPAPRLRTVLLWIALAAIPSSLMLGVTSFATTDVAPVPLLWVIPLALYLITFILAFMRRPLVSHVTAMRWLPFAIVAIGFLKASEVTRPNWLILPAHLASFFVVALACHGELARTRPPAQGLTAFYLLVSFGGVVGSAFNAIAAPLLFSSLAEYPLAVAFAALVPIASLGLGLSSPRTWQEVESAPDDDQPARPQATRVARGLARELGPAALLALGLAGVLVATRHAEESWRTFILAQVAAAAAAVSIVFRSQPLRFAACTGALLLTPLLAARAIATVHSSRSFFATHRVVDDTDAHRRLYVQGTTVHGLQSTLPDRARIAGAYYHRSGPAGDVLTRLPFRRAGMIGLGVGSLATYAERGQSVTFFEIDPDVAAIAENPKLFTFLRQARDRGAKVDVVLGDARLTLASAPDGAFDLLVFDAYSSDVVPVHLLTRQALAMYRRKLAPSGLLLMNMSNRYLDLGVVVAALVREIGWVAAERTDLLEGDQDRAAEKDDGKAASRWIVLGSSEAEVARLGLGGEWRPLEPNDLRPWTDDYVDLLACMRW